MREPDGPDLPLATQPIDAALATSGRRRSAAERQRLLIGASFGDGRWVWLDGGHHGIGLVIAEKV